MTHETRAPLASWHVNISPNWGSKYRRKHIGLHFIITGRLLVWLETYSHFHWSINYLIDWSFLAYKESIFISFNCVKRKKNSRRINFFRHGFVASSRAQTASQTLPHLCHGSSMTASSQMLIALLISIHKDDMSAK